jgi:hypothetical protein
MGLEKLSSWSFSKVAVCAGVSISKMIFLHASGVHRLRIDRA